MSVRTLARRTGILLAAVYLLAPFIRCEDNAVELWKMLSPIASGGCQAISGPEAQDTYTIGVIAGLSDPGEPLKVFEVTGDGPAAMAGIQKGDSLWGTDAKGDPLVIDACELLRREASGTENLALYRKPSDQQQQTKVTAQPRRRREVFPGDSRMQWKVISGYMDGGRFRVSGALARGSLGDFELRLGIYNLQTEKLLQLDESKIFLLDEQGTEFTHQSFTDWKQTLRH